MRQFISVKFKPAATNTYMYHNDGVRVAVGDFVAVAARDRDGWQAVEVVSVDHDPPEFATKPIIGPAPIQDPEAAVGKDL